MNKQVYRQDMIAAVVIIMVGVAAFVLSLVMPGKIVSSGLMVLGVLLIFDSIRKIRKDVPTDEEPARLGEFQSPVIVLALLILYVLAVIYIGFYISTPAMLVIYMYFMGIRNIKTILITTAVVMAFVYCLFTLQLGVPLPAGILG